MFRARPGQSVAESRSAGLRRIVLAFSNSHRGFAWLLRHEAAFRQEVLLAVVMIPVALVLDLGPVHKALLVVAVLLVLLIEILNTAIEAVVDRIGPERHELSGLAKDLGSGAVYLSFVMAAVIWGGVLLGAAR